MEDAQDIAQESQIRLMRYRGQPHGALKVLLYRIALNLARDLWRQRAANRDRASSDPSDGMFEVPTPDPGPDQRAMQQQELVRIRNAIARLPDHCRRIYLLNRIEGLSYSQIARHANVSVKAVEKQISKALALLRQQLGDRPGPGDRDPPA
nr:RNA polymerase sigma factor [Luteimonas sp. Y-2-2-4F]